MNILKTIILSLSIGIFSIPTFGQRKINSVELGVLIGGTNYIGDLTEGKYQFFNPAGGIMLRYNPNNYLSLRANLLIGKLSAADKDAEANERKVRNLDFYSSLFEFSGMLEINFFGYNAVGSSKNNSKGFSPYAFGGVSLFSFRPKTELNGQTIELQPQGTEGQNTTALNERKKYALTQISFPIGVGIKFRLLPKTTMGIEYGLRITNTDYIDDVSLTYVDPSYLSSANGANAAALNNRSGIDQGPYENFTYAGKQRGDNQKTDKYAFAGVTISYALLAREIKCFSF